MSNLTEILIEKLKLQPLLRDRVFVKWEDQSGSRSIRNMRNLKFFMQAYYDVEGHIHIHFSLEVSIKLGGKKQNVEMLLVIPPDADFSDTLEPRSISTIDNLSPLDIAAIHDAELSASLQVIHTQFDLSTKSFIIMKKPTTKLNMNSWDITSAKLLRSLESLSNTTSFGIYIKPNDYARVGLRHLRDRLSNTPTDTRKINMKEMYIEQVPQLVEWKSPPPYTAQDVQRSTEVQVPRSPPIADVDANGDIVPATPSLLPVSHGIFSSDCEESSNITGDLDLDDICKDSGHVEPYLEVDSDEEYLAMLNAQQLSQQLRQDTSSEALRSEFKEWIKAAMAINQNVYKHSGLTKKLFALGESVHTSNLGMFDAIRPWCSALFLCDPTDSSRVTDEWFVTDMAELIKWVNTFQRGAEMTILMDDFLELGSDAREGNMDQYKRRKVDFLLRIWVEYEYSSNSMNEESSKVLSRKRNTLKTGGNVSKRARTAA
ncbi:lim domain-containing serine threonine- kinase protein [Rutstroemia sp. NJR-2017a WRK4]|nr:lim domain-containing serine threonine- kinase protein [Rutstroemia sp. NJR-2017a WRK4]